MIIILMLFAYLFMAILTFKILEIKKIGFQSYWFDGDKDLIWSISAIIMSIFWIPILPIISISKLVDTLIKAFIDYRNEEKK